CRPGQRPMNPHDREQLLHEAGMLLARLRDIERSLAGTPPGPPPPGEAGPPGEVGCEVPLPGADRITESAPLYRIYGRAPGELPPSQEASLALERQRMLMLLDSLPDSIFFKDEQSRFLQINRALALRFGLSDPAQAVGKCDLDFFPEAFARKTRADEL